jgi:hypothetical protein
MEHLPGDVRVHLLPSGPLTTPLVSWRYRRTTGVTDRIDAAFVACDEYLGRLKAPA